jgi:hypothetical protein
MDTKRCSRCGEQLPLSMFYRGYPHGDGLTPHCKRCAATLHGKIYRGTRNKDRDAEIPEDLKFCPKCKNIKLLSEFDRATRASSGYQSHCKDCRRKKHREGKPEPEILPEGMKRCWECKRILPAIAEVFSRSSREKDGFQGRCKACYAAYRKANRERINQQKNEHYTENRETILQKRRAEYPEKREVIYEAQKRYNNENKEKIAAQRRAYYQANKESIREKRKPYLRVYNAAYRIKNRERIRELSRKRYADNPQAKRDEAKRFRQNNPEKVRLRNREWYYKQQAENTEHHRQSRRIRESRRRARKGSFANTFSLTEWLECLQYWNHSCPVCGNVNKLHADHWIPLTNPDCLGTVADNIIPLCQHCNISKSNLEAKVWLIRKLGEELGLAKLAEIEAYFQHVRERKS